MSRRRKDKDQEGNTTKETEVGDIEALKERNIGDTIIRRLRDRGITNLRHVRMFNPEELVDILGVDPEVARKLIEAARDLLNEEPRIMTAKERVDFVNKLPVVKTGVEGFDDLVGGLRFGFSYEFSGEFGSGKTLMAMQSSIAAIKQYGVGVVYIDTEKTVDAYLNSGIVNGMIKRFGLNEDEVKERHFMIYNPATVDELENFVTLKLANMVTDSNVKVVVVDSITALYRAEFRGRERLAERQQRLHYVLDWLRRLTIKEGILVIYTNQVMEVPLGYIPIKRPAGGNVVGHTVNQRWFMERSRSKPEGVFRALDVPGVPPTTEVKFTIQDDGLH